MCMCMCVCMCMCMCMCMRMCMRSPRRPLPQVVTALLSLLSSGGPRPPGCTSLTALASAVEWFCKTAEARPQMATLTLTLTLT